MHLVLMSGCRCWLCSTGAPLVNQCSALLPPAFHSQVPVVRRALSLSQVAISINSIFQHRRFHAKRTIADNGLWALQHVRPSAPSHCTVCDM